MEAYRPDHAREDVHNQGWNWGQLWNNVTETGSNSLWTGAMAVGAGVLGLVAVRIAQSAFGSKVNSLTDSYFPSFKGALNASLVIGASNMVAIPASKFLNNRDHETLATITGVLTVFLATAALTPKVSRQLSTYPVGYLGASLYGLAGAGMFAVIDNSSDLYSKRSRASYWDGFVQTATDSLSAGVWGLAATTLGLLAVKTVHTFAHALWGTVPAAAVVGLSTAMTLPLSHRVAKRFEDEDTQVFARIITSAVVALLATAICTTKLSTKIGPYRVSYLGAAGYGLIGALTADAATLIDCLPEDEKTKKFNKAQQRRGHPIDHAPMMYDKEDYLRMGVLSLGAGALTSLIGGIFLGLANLWTRSVQAAPVLNGSVTVGLVGGAATSVALVTANWKKYEKWMESPEHRPKPFPNWDFAARVALVFATIVAVAPTASKYLSSYKVSYLQAAGLSVAGVAGAVELVVGAVIAKNIYDDMG